VAYCDCSAKYGGHAHPELVYTEIVGDNGLPVPEGTAGELVATPLGVEGTPLVRYKTGTSPLSCPENAVRAQFDAIGPILAESRR